MFHLRMEASGMRTESVVDAVVKHINESFEYSMGGEQEDQVPAKQPLPVILKHVKAGFKVNDGLFIFWFGHNNLSVFENQNRVKNKNTLYIHIT